MIWLVQLVFDCRDPDAVMQFWGCALGYRSDLIGLTPEAVREFRAANPQFDSLGRIDDRELRRMPVYIQRVPEPKAGRNRARLEIGTPPGELAATAGELVRPGATARAGAGDLLDPEGNEFCVVPAAAGQERRLRTIVLRPATMRGCFGRMTVNRGPAGRSICMPSWRARRRAPAAAPGTRRRKDDQRMVLPASTVRAAPVT